MPEQSSINVEEFLSKLKSLPRKNRRAFAKQYKIPMIPGTNIPLYERHAQKLKAQMEGNEKA